MITVNTKISEDDLKKLQEVCERTDRSKSYVLRKALQKYLEDEKDYADAVEIMKNRTSDISLDEIKAKYGLDN